MLSSSLTTHAMKKKKLKKHLTITFHLRPVTLAIAILTVIAVTAGVTYAAIYTTSKSYDRVKQTLKFGSTTQTITAGSDVARRSDQVIVTDCTGSPTPATCEKYYQDTVTYRTYTTSYSGQPSISTVDLPPNFYIRTLYYTSATMGKTALVTLPAAGAKEYAVSTSRTHTYGDDHTTTETLAGETLPTAGTLPYYFRTTILSLEKQI